MLTGLVSAAADNPTLTTLPGRDAETMALLRRRDQQGLRFLLADHGGIVRERLVRRFYPQLDHSEIDEALSQALHQVWLAAPQFDPTLGTLRGWFAVIAQHAASKALTRRRPAWLHLSDRLDERAEASNVHALHLAGLHDLVHDTRACIELLPHLQRDVLRADLAIRGTADSELLAKGLGTTPATIYAARSQGRSAVIEMLKRSGHRIGQPRNNDESLPPRAETG